MRQRQAGVELDRLLQRPHAADHVAGMGGDESERGPCVGERGIELERAPGSSSGLAAGLRRGCAMPRAARKLWQSASADQASAYVGIELERAAGVAQPELQRLPGAGDRGCAGS